MQVVAVLKLIINFTISGTGVTANAVHPGIVDTEIIRHMGFFNSWIATILIKPFVWPFIKGPRQGAQTVIFAAIEPELENISGKYFRYILSILSFSEFNSSNFSDYNDVIVSPEAQDESTAKWLWAVSEKWTRLALGLSLQMKDELE